MAGAAAALVAGAIVISHGAAGDPSPAPRTAPAGRPLAGIPQSGIALGSEQAPATLVEFADLQCPYCGVFAREVLPTVVQRYVRTGRLRLESRVLAFVGDDSVRAGRMAAAAALQDRLWDFTGAFYANQGTENTGYVTDGFLDRTATSAGVDVAAARSRQGTPAAVGMLETAQREAGRLGVRGTPSFFVRRGDGPPQSLEVRALTPAAFTAALDRALAAG